MQALKADVYRKSDTERFAEGGLGKKVVTPSARKAIAKWVVAEQQISIKLACVTFCISQTCYRYEPILNDENKEIADWLLQLTTAQKRWRSYI